ncbi:hypothetical protein [Ideonella sp.]|uniref:hypothetical protein n=1 Tax=Ideonella sp. TaxID=1929293 RepID=UPI0035AE1194
MIRSSRRAAVVLGLVAAVAVTTGCASKVKATRTQNPPPTEAYGAFGRIEVKPIVLAPAFAGDDANQRAMAKIQENLDKELAPHLAGWNKRADNGRRLVLEPVIEEIRFIGVGARIWTGPLAGSSGVRMTLRAKDAATGKPVDNAEFYQRSSAGSGFALGVADNLMLTRTAQLIAQYVVRNHAQAVGGPTGATEELVAPAAK